MNRLKLMSESFRPADTAKVETQSIVPLLCKRAVPIMVFTLACGILWINGSAGTLIGQFATELSDDEQTLATQLQADEKVFTARQISLFHRRFADRCLAAIPNDAVTLAYRGIAATDNGRLKQRIHGDLGSPLEWDVQQDVVIFSIAITTNRLASTIAHCELEDCHYYVTVNFTDDNRGIDVQYKDLGNLTIRQIVERLESKDD